ncbi:cysteine proteinase RD21a-like [Trifolium medium]|uniref:Cysteine proteinase RD21a-like n=1 Tax=Trifolium medium TaxID=97028 RepID=A0A392PU48_9FABA|nr:cysteine proteinase RD21a-like [Trifolium medium]
MLLIGYGSYEGQDVWILQNSYGEEDWGIGGYMYLQRNSRTISGRCGVLIAPAYPIFEYEDCDKAVERGTELQITRM